ncbi:acyltransferase [Phenylobacterium aquaticum]|uniref:acyltransferase family protein n=1 Tax=Phenylobacterium aquaticum TaxID=1763816 RepID=UPI0026EEC96E|nr:acyltransferase [Phenylobacterium aquaticum]
MGPGSERAPRSALLDLLRFAAAGLIVLYHYRFDSPIKLDLFSPLFDRGYLATDFFLILSGYVLGRAYGRQIALGKVSDEQFLLRRVMRVWPAHVVMLVAFAAVIGAAEMAGRAPHNAAQVQWRDWPAQLALIQAWGLHRGEGWNVPTWTLSALIVCYAGFPTLWRRTLGDWPAASLLVIGVSVLAGADLVSEALYGQGVFDLPSNLGVMRALPLFVFGALVARASEAGWPLRRWAPWQAIAAFAGFCVLQATGKFDLPSMALLGLMIGAAGEIPARGQAKLAWQAAKVSFALYITHIFVATLWFNFIHAVDARFNPPAWEQWSLWGMAFPAALIAAVVFERWADRPLQAGVAALLRPRPGRYPALAPNGSGRRH